MISIAVITFVTIFLVALGVVIIVLIMQYVNDKKKKKDLLMKVRIFYINKFVFLQDVSKTIFCHMIWHYGKRSEGKYFKKFLGHVKNVN